MMIVNDELEKIQQLTMGWMIWGSNPGGGKVFHNHLPTMWVTQPPIQWLLG
jgi:hypothetical protein